MLGSPTDAAPLQKREKSGRRVVEASEDFCVWLHICFLCGRFELCDFFCTSVIEVMNRFLLLFIEEQKSDVERESTASVKSRGRSLLLSLLGEWMDKWRDGWRSRMVECTGEWTMDMLMECMYVWIDVWMGEWMEGWMDKWLCG